MAYSIAQSKIHLMKPTTLITFFLSFATLIAEPLKTTENTKTFADTIMKQAGKGDFEKAFNHAKKAWDLPEAEVDKLAKLTASQLLETFKPTFGAIVESEFVGKKVVGKSFIKYYYLLKMENRALRWQIVFYKPKDEWKLDNIKWDDQIKQLFREKPLLAE